MGSGWQFQYSFTTLGRNWQKHQPWQTNKQTNKRVAKEMGGTESHDLRARLSIPTYKLCVFHRCKKNNYATFWQAQIPRNKVIVKLESKNTMHSNLNELILFQRNGFLSGLPIGECFPYGVVCWKTGTAESYVTSSWAFMDGISVVHGALMCFPVF